MDAPHQSKGNADPREEIGPLIRALPDGTPLPNEWPYSFLYRTVEYAGQTIPFCDGETCVFVHFEHDDVIQELLAGDVTAHAGAEDGRIILSLLFRSGGAINRIALTFDSANRDSARLLRSLAVTGAVELILVNFIYGMMVKERIISIPLPHAAIAEIEKAAG